MMVDFEQNYSQNIWLMLVVAVKLEEDPQRARKTLLVLRLHIFGEE